jgi:cytochrome c oxidase subunit II
MTPTTPATPRRFPIAALLLIAVAVCADAAVSLWMARASHHWLPVQASAAAPYVDDLFALETGIGSFIFLGCIAVMAWTLLFNRAPKYDMEDGDPIEGNLKLEITWTIIPLVIVMLIATHAIRISDTLATIGGKQRVQGGEQAVQVAEGSQGAAAVAEEFGPIEVIARQWSWEFVYPDGTRSGELHLPVNQRTRFKLISMDVLHGFYVPAFRLKQDLVPGSVIDYSLVPTREGRYRLRDSMFSGGYFSTNQTDVVVESAEGFRRWLAEAARAPLRESPNAAVQLWQARLARGDKGWATVPPATPPMVNVIHDSTAPHEG